MVETAVCSAVYAFFFKNATARAGERTVTIKSALWENSNVIHVCIFAFHSFLLPIRCNTIRSPVTRRVTTAH